MTTPAIPQPPIACTLNAAEYRSRAEDLSVLAARALRSRERTRGGERLTFEATDEHEHALRRVVAAEAECCPFLHLTLDRTGDAIVLDVTGPAEARPIIEQLFA